MTPRDDPDLIRQTMALVGVMLQCVEGDGQDVVRRHIAQLGLDLLDQVTLFQRQPHVRLVDPIDEHLALLRVQVELAHHLDVLSERDFLDLSEQLDVVGRQLGRWQKKVGR